jgi:hypothetical protein
MWGSMVCKKIINTEFVGSTNTINICLILSTIYIFIPASGCVGRGPSALFCTEVYNAAKTALIQSQINSQKMLVLLVVDNSSHYHNW